MFKLVSLIAFAIKIISIRTKLNNVICKVIFIPSKDDRIWNKLSLVICVFVFFQSHDASGFRNNIGFWRVAEAAPTPMVMSWKTDNTSPGSSGANQIQLPLVVGSTYNFIVYWGDGANNTITSWSDVGALHTYVSAGTYTITLLGQVDRFYFNNTGDRYKILDISAWGNTAWKSMASMFYGCGNLNISALDSPNLKSVTDMSWMFSEAYNFNGNISSWATAAVTDMSYMFFRANSFNQNLNSWNTAAVTNMSYMFKDTGSFNGNISSWNTGAVTNMSYMFHYATAFNQNLSSWNVTAVGTNYTNYRLFADAWMLPKPPGFP